VACSLLSPPCGKATATGVGEPLISCHDQRVSVTSHSLPLVNLLDRIAKSCSVRIFSLSDIPADTVVEVEMADQKVEKALAGLLEGYNNIVVYNAGPEKAGLCLRAGMPPGYDAAASTASSQSREASPAAESGPEAGGQRPSATANQSEFLRAQIDRLNKRIESGVSDRMYQEAIKTKNPAFVQNDRTLLARYEERLARLENGGK
jgi:hypothetical protein